jgi:hypothetical protein
MAKGERNDRLVVPGHSAGSHPRKRGSGSAFGLT